MTREIRWIVLTTILSASLPALADTKIASVGPWQIDAVDGSGQFEGCRASRQDGDLLFSFTRGGDGTGVRLVSARWRLDRGAQYKVSLSAAGGNAASAAEEVQQASAVAGNELVMPVSSAFIRSLEGRSELEVRPVSSTFRVQLARAPEALKALDECWTARMAKVAPAAMPPASSPPSAAPGQEAGKRAEILPERVSQQEVAAFSLSAFGVSADADVQPGADGSFNIVQDDGVTIVRSAATTGAMNTIVYVIAANVGEVCKVAPPPDVLELDVNAPIKLARFSLGCDTAGGPVSFDTSLVSDGKRLRIFTSIGQRKGVVTQIGKRVFDEIRKAYRS